MSSKERVSEPSDRFEFVTRVVERLDLLGITDDRLTKLRAAVAKADDGSDDEVADFLVNPQGAQENIRRRLGAGDIDLEQARDELIALQARAAADEVLSKMVSNVASQRRSAAWNAATQVDWDAVLIPTGRTAADRVNELGPRLPADQSDRSVNELDKDTRKANDEFRDALGRYRSVAALLVDLRWNKLQSFEPLTTDEAQRIAGSEWYYSGLYGALATEHRDSFVQELQHGAVAGVPTPADILHRMEDRSNLRQAAEGVARQGWDIPGVDVAADHRLPARIHEQLPQRVRRSEARGFVA